MVKDKAAREGVEGLSRDDAAELKRRGSPGAKNEVGARVRDFFMLLMAAAAAWTFVWSYHFMAN